MSAPVFIPHFNFWGYSLLVPTDQGSAVAVIAVQGCGVALSSTSLDM